jgi:hypothetical protein
LEVREHPQSMQKNIDGRLPGRWGRRSRSAHYQRKKKTRWRAHWDSVPVVRERLPSTQKMSMVCTLGGVARGSGVPPIHAKNVDGRPPGRRGRRSGSTRHQHKKYRWRAQGGGVRGPGAPTINTKNVEVPPWEAVLEVQECLPSMPKNIDDRPHGRRCQRSESAHHQCKKH